MELIELQRDLAQMYRNLDGPLGSRAAAEVMVPLFVDAVRPASVLDVGCGVGSFMREFSRFGIEDVLGVDAPAFDDSLLVVDPHRVHRADLRQPLDLGRRFDLAICLEVAGYFREHEVLVASLVRHSRMVVFSAAIPGQEMPRQPYGAFPSYWAAQFARHGYQVVDAFRGRIWDNDQLPFWFRQNVLLFAEQAALAQLHVAPAPAPLDVVHPRLYEGLVGSRDDTSFRHGLGHLRRAAKAKVRQFERRYWRRSGSA